MKARLDKFLVERGLVPSRERAQALILAGRVLVNEQKVEKPGAAVPEDAAVRLLGDDLRYVSRGGLKLEAALARWEIDLTGRVCADVGASTGGFTDCMLQHGAAAVLAIDTGYGQIAHKLRVDPRVTLLERTNARKLERQQVTLPVTFLRDGCFVHLGDSGAAGSGGGDAGDADGGCGAGEAAVRGGTRACWKGRDCARSGRRMRWRWRGCARRWRSLAVRRST